MPIRLEWLDKETEKKFKNWCTAKYGLNRRGNLSLGFTEMIEFFTSPDIQDIYQAWTRSKLKTVAMDRKNPLLFTATNDKTLVSQPRRNRIKK